MGLGDILKSVEERGSSFVQSAGVVVDTRQVSADKNY